MVVWSFLLLLTLPISNEAITCLKAGNHTPCTSESTVCYRHGQIAGCLEDCPDPHDTCGNERRKEMCCCSTDNCNRKEKPHTTTLPPEPEPGWLDDSSNKIILIVALGLSVFIIAILCIFYYRRQRNKKTKEIPTVSSNNKDPEVAPIETEKKAPSVNEEEDGKGAEDLIEHEDLTTMQIEPVLAIEEKEELIASLKNPSPLPSFEFFSNPPKLTKLITYGTNDAITVVEEFVKSPDEIPTDDFGFCAHILAKLISNGPREYHYDLYTLKKILQAAEKVFANECSLLTINVPCTIYGDIHGQYSDLHRWLNVNGWPTKRRSIFLGDFVDRGSHGVEVVAIMCCLKVVFPDRFFVCRGNHEEECLNKTYSFYKEVEIRFKDTSPGDENIYAYFKRVFGQLPLAAIIGNKILGMHGGLSPKLNTLQDIRDIKRPIAEFLPGTLACDLVWSDPDLGSAQGDLYRPNFDREPNDGIGQLFTSTAVLDTCKRLDVVLIIRGHQAPREGYARWADGHLVTLFSAPGYKGETENTVNMGACIEANEDGLLVVKQIKVSEEFRQKRIADVKARAFDVKN